jgi:hypothetical protein
MPASGPLMCESGSPTSASGPTDRRDRDRAAAQRHRAADQRDQVSDDPE